MNSETRPSSPTDLASPPAAAGRETLLGDRLCMRCFHPLAGRTIERDPATGLLFVRCGECATASALFEYPTAAPWVRRFQTVAIASFAFLALAVVGAIFGITVGFASAVPGFVAQASTARVVELFEEGGGLLETPVGYGRVQDTIADSVWLASDAGKSAMRAARSDARPLLMLTGFCALGTLVIAPFVLAAGLVCMRRTMVTRVFVCGGLPLISGLTVLLDPNRVWQPAVFWSSPQTWYTWVTYHNSPFFLGVVVAWFAFLGIVGGIVGPAFVARFFRFVLPPSDRRLVAWLWHWRGKPVPLD